MFVKQMYSTWPHRSLKKLVRKPLAHPWIRSFAKRKKENWRRRRRRRRKIRPDSKETVFFFLFSTLLDPSSFFSLPPRSFSFHTSNRDKGKIKEEEEKLWNEEVRSDGEIFEPRFKAVKRTAKRRGENRMVKENP